MQAEQPGAGCYRRYHRPIGPPTAVPTRPAFGLAVIAAVIIAAGLAVFAVAQDDRATTSAGLPQAPWRSAAVRRPAVPAPYVSAWDRARNRSTCALLFPLDGGPALVGANATEQKTPDDNGWDIFLTSTAGTVEVLGLFDRSSPLPTSQDVPAYGRTWDDGSEARYTAEVGRAAPGTFDPDTSPFEAVLTIPGQRCAYRIYDTLGKDHLESVFDRLRLMAP